MENLLDYLLYALFGHNVTAVYANNGSGYNALTGRTWTIVFEGHVYITIDESDLRIIRNRYAELMELFDDEEKARYQRIFDMCV